MESACFHFENRLLLVPLTGLVNSPFSFSKIGLDFGSAETGWKIVADWLIDAEGGWY